MRLHISLALGGAHDSAEVMLWSSSKLAGTGPGTRMAIALGEDGDVRDVWTGEVTAVSGGSDGVVIDGLAATLALSRSRVSQTYLDQSVADIVRDLASEVDIDEVSADTHLPAYAVDDRRPVWSHLLDLAELAGADLGAGPSGGLRFVPPRSGSADVRLRHGVDLLSWSTGTVPEPQAPGVAAHGAASEAGADQWHWILRRPAAAGGAGGPLRVVAALRTRDAADRMAQALASRAARASVQGRLRIVGRPEIRPGDLVEATDLPSGDLGTLRVLAVDHVLDGRQGFVTTLSVEGSER